MILFCALCIQIQIFLCVHKSWGASLVSLEHSFAHIIISFDCLLQLVSFDCMIACFSLCYLFVAYLSVAIFGPQYSLSSSKYWQLDMCTAFHSLVEKYKIYGGTQFIGLLNFSPILAIDANGGEVSESFVEKFSEFCSCFGFVPKHLHLILMHHWLLHRMVMHNSLHKLLETNTWTSRNAYGEILQI